MLSVACSLAAHRCLIISLPPSETYVKPYYFCEDKPIRKRGGPPPLKMTIGLRNTLYHRVRIVVDIASGR